MAKPDAIRPIQAAPKIIMFLYGPPGNGKTRLIGSGGKGTLIVRPSTDHTDSIRTPGVEEWEVEDWAEMYNVEEYVRHEGYKEYDWIWLDSISLFQDTGLDDIWEGVVAQKPHRAQYSLDKGEYGINMWRLQTWIRDMVGIKGFNLGITAHPEYLPNPITGEVKLQPYVQGKNMSTKIQGYCNIVAYLEVVVQEGKNIRVLRTEGSENYEAKDQFDAFPNGRLVNPTMEKIQNGIDAARASRIDEVASRRTSKRAPVRRRAQS
jgi:AAA domain